MDILKRSLAPIPQEGWAAIDDRARQTLSGSRRPESSWTWRGRSARISRPCPWDGWSSRPSRWWEGVRFGLHKVQPLVEVRVPFELDVTEIDNVVRGAKDIDLAGLDQAAMRLAEFEECAVYYGSPQAAIQGLHDVAGHPPLAVCCQPEMIVERVTMAITAFRSPAVQGPYSMVVSPEIWSTLSGQVRGFPERLPGKHAGRPHPGQPLRQGRLPGHLTRGGDLKLTIGQDIAIGYASHTADKVGLFLTESFTFRVLDPLAVMRLEWGKQ